MKEHITSRQNELSQHLARLGGTAGYRRRCGEYLCDGTKLLADALNGGIIPLTVAAAEDFPLPPLPAATRVVTMPARLIESLAPTETPQGVLFVCAIPEELSAPPETGRFLLLDGVQDPGNVGSVLRSAEAFGISGVYLSGGCADPFGPKAVRAGMGAVFRLPVGRVTPEDLLTGPLPLYAAALRPDAMPITDMPGGDCVVALGSEGRGLGRDILERAAGTLYIPMKGGAQSLGVAAAAAVVLWRLTIDNG